MKNSKLLIYTTAIIFFIALANACQSNTTSQTNTAFIECPTEGKFCFQLESENQDSPEFIYLEYDDKKVEGCIFFEEEVNGNVFYNFKGTLTKDSILSVEINYYQDDMSEEWIIFFTENGITVKNSFGRDKVLNYISIPCDKMPNQSDYLSIEEIAEEEYAEYSENNTEFPEQSINNSTYYEAYFPNLGAYQRIQKTEYIQLWEKDGSIYGRGCGSDEGCENWTFNFSGTQTNGSMYQVQVNYLQLGKEKWSLDEVWIVNLEKGEIKLDQKIDERPGAELYRTTDPEFIPYGMIKIMSKEIVEDSF